MEQFGWTEISRVPSKPGVYAWYYNPEITDFDLEQTIKRIDELTQENNISSARETVKNFLEKFLFDYFTEDPYQVSLRGALKPKYEGQINHIPSLSQSLVDRIVFSPDKLKTIKAVIEKSAPFFSSPIYIGMAEDLNKRLHLHKKLIEKYRSEILKAFSFNKVSGNDNKEIRDQSFAWQVCKRNISPAKLFVVIKIIDETEHGYLDIENILNRIHYPLFGRN